MGSADEGRAFAGNVGQAPCVEWEMMDRNPNLDMPLTMVLKKEIALSLQRVAQIYTVGGLLEKWGKGRGQREVEELFDTPEQARQAVAVCATWVGGQTTLKTGVVTTWWAAEEAGAKA
jgi:hypothetical protein